MARGRGAWACRVMLAGHDSVRTMRATAIASVAALLAALGATTSCKTYTRCEACFSDDPADCWDAKLSDPLGDRNADAARCSAARGLCESVDSRCMQGVCNPSHAAQCKENAESPSCPANWLRHFEFRCESQRVGPGVPF